MQHRLLNLLLILFSGLLIPASFAAAPSTFTVVIDPGHGGKDSGTLGTSIKEKDVVLSVGLKLGQLIKRQHPDVKVIYTRSTDVFIPLDQRAMIANKAKANLFLSIHADHAETPTVRGASTFTLGQNRTRENFEIAKRENSVILLEDDYKQRYEGFDPNSAESYIMFEFMQDNYMNQSIQFASILQEKFMSSGRKDRGVRQDVFLVLRCTSMPSVLVELGFLSNHEEEQFLKSEEGRDQMALALLRGFSDFKNNYERKSTGNSAIAKKVSNESFTERRDSGQSQSQKTDSAGKRKNVQSQTSKLSDKITTDTDIIFKVQVITSSFKLKENDKKFRGNELDYFFENKLYKYTYGKFSSFDEANLKRRELRKFFPDAFVIALKNGQKIAVDDARAQTKH
ncbi:MAG: N-acetylmuramoyl-L-alanine amidase [Bacteroidales bacterium]|nr:N-acetylmuramoyl-L-alanine amidase [Bacteroidales bacterium]MDD2611795.1 N-acetylmuramoyl-L-alanine amidase [Bacteroidales bacterium]MDD3907515.1 N-acetylmuramoyl-L-alanine amidase [Bacteroidales bacterium]MDD4712218.1 N-acetylmuramoyl-L-alanine amidase [Bacteroidales bacterium]